jgi:tripartite-type tricarboxylate transporter receptor subunit TctC
MDRRSFCAATGATALTLALPRSLFAQGKWPARPITVIVPFPAGGGTDVLTRGLAEKMQAGTGWTIVVDNKGGASGNIGLAAAAKAAPDGHTIAMGQTANLAINPTLFPSVPFDPLKDFAPIILVAQYPVAFVVAEQSKYKTIGDVIAAAKAKPGEVTMATPGQGTVAHLAGELFQRKAGVKFTHVPYKGAAQALINVVGGQVDLFIASTESVMSQVSGGKVRPLAVTSAKRISALEKVPTIAESGYPGFEAPTWFGLVAPAKTPAEIITRLNAEAEKALQNPDFVKRLAGSGGEPIGGPPQRFAELLRTDFAKWGAVVREAGIKPE